MLCFFFFKVQNNIDSLIEFIERNIEFSEMCLKMFFKYDYRITILVTFKEDMKINVKKKTKNIRSGYSDTHKTTDVLPDASTKSSHQVTLQS